MIFQVIHYHIQKLTTHKTVLPAISFGSSAQNCETSARQFLWSIFFSFLAANSNYNFVLVEHNFNVLNSAVFGFYERTRNVKNMQFMAHDDDNDVGNPKCKLKQGQLTIAEQSTHQHSTMEPKLLGGPNE